MADKLFLNEKRVSDDNRRGEDPRRSKVEAPDEDRRSSDRREGADRRMRIHNLYISTRKSVSELEDFLDSECQEYWAAVFLEADRQTAATRFVLQFVSVEDRDRILTSMPESGIF